MASVAVRDVVSHGELPASGIVFIIEPLVGRGLSPVPSKRGDIPSLPTQRNEGLPADQSRCVSSHSRSDARWTGPSQLVVMGDTGAGKGIQSYGLRLVHDPGGHLPQYAWAGRRTDCASGRVRCVRITTSRMRFSRTFRRGVRVLCDGLT
jgi:hypothetical protein